MKVFTRGLGGGSGPVKYTTAKETPLFSYDPDTGKSSVVKDSDGKTILQHRDPPPVVVRGDPQISTQLIDGIERKWKYTSGVLSWEHGEKITPKKENEIINSFEKVAFAGLEQDQYNILWVRHTHEGHHELHFIIPRTELSTGKAFNPCPPGWQKDFDVFRDLHNYKENWSRPDDPARKREFQPGFLAQIKGKEDQREYINAYVRQCIEIGKVNDRSDIIAALKEVDLDVSRQGENYITVSEPQKGSKTRLKGGLYAKGWTIERTLTEQNEAGQRRDRSFDHKRVSELNSELEKVCIKRAGYNRIRYPNPTQQLERSNVKDHINLSNEITKGLDQSHIFPDISLDAHLRRTLGDNRIEVEVDKAREENYRSGIPFHPTSIGFERDSRENKGGSSVVRPNEHLGIEIGGKQEREIYNSSSGMDVGQGMVREFAAKRSGQDFKEIEEDKNDRNREVIDGITAKFRERWNQARGRFNEAFVATLNEDLKKDFEIRSEALTKPVKILSDQVKVLPKL